VTDEQRGRRPIFIATLRAGASWPFFLPHGGSTRMTQIWALRSRLEKRPTDLRQNTSYLYSEVFDLKPTSGLYPGSGALEYWSVVGGRMSAVRMNIEGVGSVEESFSRPERQTIGAGAEWPQLATYPQSPFSGPAGCCDVAYLSQAFSQPTSPGRLWISLGASLLLVPIGGSHIDASKIRPY